MRILFSLIFFGLAIWRGYTDWNTSSGQGEDLALTPTISIWETFSPGTFSEYLPLVQATKVPYLWDPILQTFLNWPAALVLLGISVFFFAIRRKVDPDDGLIY